MRPSEFVRSISEVDVALGRLRGFVCTEEGCEGKWKTCDQVSEEITRKLLNKLRELGLLGELEKVVGRPVTVDDLCVFWKTTWFYPYCVSPQYASKERCRKEYRRALEGARERLKNAPELKKRLENLLVKLDGVGRFKLEHFFTDGVTYLELPLPGCDTELWLWHNLFNKGFEVTYYYPPYGEPPTRELGEWFAESVGEALRSLGMNRYEATIDYNEVEIRLSGLDLDTAFRLFEIFAGLAPAFGEACAVLPMRHRAGKTGVRVRV